MEIPPLKPKTTKSNKWSVFTIEPISNPYRLGDHHTLSDCYSENSLLSKTSKDEAKLTYSCTIRNAPASDGASSKR